MLRYSLIIIYEYKTKLKTEITQWTYYGHDSIRIDYHKYIFKIIPSEKIEIFFKPFLHIFVIVILNSALQKFLSWPWSISENEVYPGDKVAVLRVRGNPRHEKCLCQPGRILQ